MNDRIRELADNIWAEEYWNNPNTDKLLPAQLNRFAELIVKECITIVDEQKECLHEEQQYWHDRDYGYEMAVNDASKGIKQFFGVEE